MNDLDQRVRRGLGQILDLAPTLNDSPNIAPIATTHRPRSGLRPALVGASFVAVIGAAGVAYLATSNSPTGPTFQSPATSGQSSPTGPTAPAVPATSTPTPLATEVSPVDTTGPSDGGSLGDPLAALDGATGLFLPTYVPAEFELASLTVNNAAPLAIPERTWVRKDAAGVVNAEIRLTVRPSSPDDGPLAASGNQTVHGLPAAVAASSQGALVTWIEQDVMVTIQGFNLSVDEVVSAANLVVVTGSPADATFDAGLLPAGFAQLQSGDLAAVGAVGMNFDLLPSAGADGRYVSVGVAPDFDQTRLEPLAVNGAELVDIGGIQRLVETQTVNGRPEVTVVTWIEDRQLISVFSNLGREEVLAFVGGMAWASPEQVLSAGRAITKKTLLLPVLDRITFSDGTEVTARTEGHGIAAICLEADRRCVRALDESTYGGGSRDSFFHLVEIGGDQVVLGWRAGAGDVTLVDSNGGDVGAPPASVESVITDVGQFVRVIIPAGGQQQALTFGDGTQYGYNTTPNLVEFG